MNDKILGLLNSPMFQAGVGLLDAGAPRVGPNNFGSNLASVMGQLSASEERRMKNEIMRQNLESNKRRSTAVNSLQSLLSQPTGTSVLRPDSDISTPEGQNNMMGLLAQINPEAVASGLLSKNKPRVSTDVATMQQLGFPLTQEGYAAFRQSGSNDSNLETLQLQLEVRQALDDMQRDKKAQGQTTQLGEIEAKSMLNEGVRMFKALDALEGSALEAGISLSDFRSQLASGLDSALTLFDKSPAVGNKVRDQYDIFKKASVRFATAMAGEGATDASLANALSASPNIAMTTGANREVLASIMSDELKKAEARGYNVDASKYLGYIEAVKNQNSVGVDKLPGFSSWSPEDQRRARVEWLRMSPEDRARMLSGS